jgi:hypothetical protein
MMTFRFARPLAIALALVGGLTLIGVSAAEARIFVGVGIGVPGPVYYAPPPVVYAPPPVVYAAPPTAYVTPPASYVTPPASAAMPGQECREYQTQTMIDGRPQPSHGTACRQPDGTWRIVN